MKTRFKKLLPIFLIFNLIFSASAYAQWVQMSSGIGNNDYPYAMTSANTNVLAGLVSVGVFRSTNNGANWIQTNLNNQTINSFYVSGGIVYACTSNGIYTSSDNGTTWSQTYLSGTNVVCVVTNGAYIIAGNTSINVSSNGGASWSTALNGLGISSLGVSGGAIFAAVNFSGVRKSTDNGLTWSTTSLIGVNPTAMIISSGSIYVSTQVNGFYVSNNGGVNWSQITTGQNNASALAKQDNYIFHGGTGVYLSSNGGALWLDRNQGFPTSSVGIYSLCIHNGYIFAGVFGLSVWRRGYSEIISPVGIQNTGNEIVRGFSLNQNYPNPFNPSTTINYYLPVSEFVSIKIFDTAGKEISSIVNQMKANGNHSVNFNSENLQSGIYFYQIHAGNYSETKKMILIK